MQHEIGVKIYFSLHIKYDFISKYEELNNILNW
jgi:hypothetical protein